MMIDVSKGYRIYLVQIERSADVLAEVFFVGTAPEETKTKITNNLEPTKPTGSAPKLHQVHRFAEFHWPLKCRTGLVTS